MANTTGKKHGGRKKGTPNHSMRLVKREQDSEIIDTFS